MSPAIGSFSFSAATYGLIAFWVQEPLPERMKRLLEVSSHDRTSGSIASLKSSLHHSITWAVLAELIAGVLPSASTTFAPWDHISDHCVLLASRHRLMGMPTGLPCFLS